MANKKKTSFDIDDSSIIFQSSNVNKTLIDTNSQQTNGNGSNSTGTKDDEDEFDLSFDNDILLDLQKGEFLLDDEWMEITLPCITATGNEDDWFLIKRLIYIPN